MKSSRSILVTSVCLAVFSDLSSLHAQLTVWGLQTGDRFTVETVIEQMTTVTLKKTSPVTRVSAERLQVEYRLDRMLPTESRFSARIVKAEAIDRAANADATQSLQLLEGASFQLTVDRKGHAQLIVGHEGLLKTIGNQNNRMIQSMYSAEALNSFLSRPFWMTLPDPKPLDDSQWERVDELSAGMLGSFRTIATCQIRKRSEAAVSVSVTGEGRYIPIEKSSALAGTVIENVKASRVDLTGEGEMWVDRGVAGTTDESEPEPGEIEARPGFQALNLTWQIEGTATLNINGDSQPLTFKETQTHKLTLMPGFEISDDEPDFNFSRPIRLR